MKIYIAGPYTKGDVAVNVRKAMEIAEQLVKMGHTPYIPHLTHFWHLVFPHPVGFWYDYDNQWLPLCDALYRIEGASSGADAEVNDMATLGRPIYHSLNEVPVIQTLPF